MFAGWMCDVLSGLTKTAPSAIPLQSALFETAVAG